MKRIIILLLTACIATCADAQARADTTAHKAGKIDKLLYALRGFRAVAYIHPQFQYFDSLNADATYAGGGGTAQTNNRFALRRGRLTLSYQYYNKKDFKVFESAFSMEVTERGFFLKDFYGRLTDPWTGWIGLQAGIFYRPVGWENTFSTTKMESPEKARFEQILYPGQRDLGAELVIESPKSFKPVYLKLEAGLFNGTGPKLSEIDKGKDFMVHFQFRKSLGKDNFSWTVSGGPTIYYGGVLQTTNHVFALKKNLAGDWAYADVADTMQKNRKLYPRQAYGGDLQMTFAYAKRAYTTLRGELVVGTISGTASGAAVPTTLGSDIFVRPFQAAVFYFVQGLKHKIKGQEIKHEFVLKYDWWDPNTKLGGTGLNNLTDAALGKADVRFSTIGIGYNFIPADFFKLMIYYDIVRNETTQIAGFTRDLRDNILTIRTQFLIDTDWFKKK